jgi:hypothetical protein
MAGDTIHVAEGWNLVGPFSDPVDTAGIVQTPPGILVPPFYGYDGAYAPADTLRPARGYWIKSSAGGTLVPGTLLKSRPDAAQPERTR